MSRMEPGRSVRRARRQFSEEFQAGAVRLVLDEGKTGLTTAEREELARLRKEREILEKAEAFFAKHQP